MSKLYQGRAVSKIMFGGREIVRSVYQGRDVYDASGGAAGGPETLLLCHFDGDYIDSSRYGREPTLAAPKYITLDANGKFGGCAAGTTGSVNFRDERFSWPDNAGVAEPLNVDSTIDFWFYPDGTRAYYDASVFALTNIADASQLKAFVYHIYNGDPVLKLRGPLGTIDLMTLDYQTWQHVGLVKQDRLVYAFKNGAKQTSQSLVSTGFTSNGGVVELSILGSASSSFAAARKIDEFRFSNVARWTADFEVPLNPYS